MCGLKDEQTRPCYWQTRVVNMSTLFKSKGNFQTAASKKKSLEEKKPYVVKKSLYENTFAHPASHVTSATF